MESITYTNEPMVVVPESEPMVVAVEPSTSKLPEPSTSKPAVEPPKRAKRARKSNTSSTPLFRDLVVVFEMVEAEPKNTKATRLLAKYFRSIKGVDLIPCLYLCLGAVSPRGENLSVGIAKGFIAKALAVASDRDVDSVKTLLSQLGEVGKVAERLFSERGDEYTASPMSCRAVYEVFCDLATLSGKQSVKKKVKLITELFDSCASGSEAKYMMRCVEGKLRNGISKRAVIKALSYAFGGTKSCNKLQELYERHADLNTIVPVLLREGLTPDLAANCNFSSE